MDGVDGGHINLAVASTYLDLTIVFDLLIYYIHKFYINIFINVIAKKMGRRGSINRALGRAASKA